MQYQQTHKFKSTESADSFTLNDPRLALDIRLEQPFHKDDIHLKNTVKKHKKREDIIEELLKME